MTNILGYTRMDITKDLRAAIYARKDITTIKHFLMTRSPSANLIEIVPNDRKKSSVFILNVYSSPSNASEDFSKLMGETMLKVKGNRLIALGDFNAPHREWNYNFNSKKGENLLNNMDRYGLESINDPSSPTRTGGINNRDSCPDLTFAKSSDHRIIWHNTNENLGSDHNIICVRTTSDNYKLQRKPARITDWEKFRSELPLYRR